MTSKERVLSVYPNAVIKYNGCYLVLLVNIYFLLCWADTIFRTDSYEEQEKYLWDREWEVIQRELLKRLES